MGAGVSANSAGGSRRGRGRRRRGKHATMSEINVTPFVDVVMVLLIIFMVAAPLMTVGVPVELPETAAEALPFDQDEEPLTVTLTAQGTIMIQTTEVAAGDLIPRLAAIAGERRSDKVFLRADGVLGWDQVAQIMGALNRGGFRNIGLVTDTGGPALGADG
ncbi:MAG: ExbD/TolR family protein [Pseudomonadota bacterium]